MIHVVFAIHAKKFVATTALPSPLPPRLTQVCAGINENPQVQLNFTSAYPVIVTVVTDIPLCSPRSALASMITVVTIPLVVYTLNFTF